MCVLLLVLAVVVVLVLVLAVVLAVVVLEVQLLDMTPDTDVFILVPRVPAVSSASSCDNNDGASARICVCEDVDVDFDVDAVQSLFLDMGKRKVMPMLIAMLTILIQSSATVK